MENYSNPGIPDILKKEGNSECVDCATPNPKWASMNNGIFLCLKCAGVHRSLGMSISLIRSLQIDTWNENQLLYLTKGGNDNFKKHLKEFNIDPASASVDIKYKSKAADYYRRFLKNEVDRESDPNYVPTQIVKPELNIAQEMLEVKEENKEENKNNETNEDKKGNNKFFGFMSSMFNKVKDSTVEAAKNVGTGFNKLNLGEKFSTAGTAIVGAVQTSGKFIADKTQQVANTEFVQNISNKTKEGFNTVVQRAKTVIQKKDASEEKAKENEQSRTEVNVKKDENGENIKEEKKEEEKKEENNEEKKEENKEEKKEENNTENKEGNEPVNNPVPEEKVVAEPEQKHEPAQ